MNYTKTSKKHYTRGFLLVVYLMITIAIYVLPSLQYVTPYIFAALLMLISFVLIFQTSGTLNYGLALLLSMVYFLVMDVFIKDDSFSNLLNEGIRHVRYFLPALWVAYVFKYCNEKQKRILLAVLTLIVAFITYRTIQAMEENRLIARLLAQDKTTSSSVINQYRLQNVGGYTFSYLVGFATIATLWLFFQFREIWKKIIAIAIVCVGYYYIVQTMYATLLILTTIGCVTIIFIRLKPNKRFIFSICVLIASFAIVPIFEYLSESFSGILLGEKFSDIAKTLSGEGVDSLGSRPKLISQAIENWTQSPLFGGEYNTSAHSLYFEYLQQRGLVGLSVWLACFFATWKLIYKNLKARDIDTRFFHVAMAYLAVLNIFNDTKTAFDITIMVFFIVPLFSMVFLKKDSSVKDKRDGN